MLADPEEVQAHTVGLDALGQDVADDLGIREGLTVRAGVDVAEGVESELHGISSDRGTPRIIVDTSRRCEGQSARCLGCSPRRCTRNPVTMEHERSSSPISIHQAMPTAVSVPSSQAPPTTRTS